MEEQQQSLKSLIWQYLEVVWRRKLCALPFPFLAALAIYYALSLPPIYQSEGVLLVEDQNIPPELIRTTVTSYAAQQMEVIRQQVESTENVLAVMSRHGLYSADSGEDPNILVQRFRDKMSLQTINVNVLDPSAGRPRIISIAFRISFQDQSPNIAQGVAEELVQIFLSKNTITRTEEAAETTVFLKEEADSLRVRVIALEDRIALFKSEHADSLPELLEYNLGVISSSEARIRENQVSIDNLSEQEQLLSIELRSMDPYTGLAIGSGNSPGNGPVTTASLLADRKAELSRLTPRYSESHPTIIALKREIQTLEDQLAAEALAGAGPDDDSILNPAYLNLRYRIGSIERDIASLVQENDNLEAQLVEFDQRVDNTYIVEREYEELLRDFNASSERYDRLRNAQYEAEVAQSLEEKNQVEGLTIIESPKLPTIPVGPERAKIAVLGLGLSGAACLALLVLLEFLDEKVRGRRSFEVLLGEAPLVSLPNIRTETEIESSKKRIKRIFLYVVLSLVLLLILGLAGVHFLVMDLTELFGL